MMSDYDRNFLKHLLRGGQFKAVLEFGSGASTLYFPKYLPDGGRWIALEDNQEWLSRIDKKLTDPRVSIIYSDTSVDVQALATQADLIIIDGGPRDQIISMLSHLQEAAGRVILLHDSQRKSYVEAKASFHEVILTPPHKLDGSRNALAGGFSLLLPRREKVVRP